MTKYYFQEIITILESYLDSTQYCNPDDISDCVICDKYHTPSYKGCRLCEAIAHLKTLNPDQRI